jgi:hypothetical protein
VCLRVRFTGYSVKHDKNFTTRQRKVPGRLSKTELDAEHDATIFGDDSSVGRNADGTFTVEKVLDVRRRSGGRLSSRVCWSRDLRLLCLHDGGGRRKVDHAEHSFCTSLSCRHHALK